MEKPPIQTFLSGDEGVSISSFDSKNPESVAAFDEIKKVWAQDLLNLTKASEQLPIRGRWKGTMNELPERLPETLHTLRSFIGHDISDLGRAYRKMGEVARADMFGHIYLVSQIGWRPLEDMELIADGGYVRDETLKNKILSELPALSQKISSDGFYDYGPLLETINSYSAELSKIIEE